MPGIMQAPNGKTQIIANFNLNDHENDYTPKDGSVKVFDASIYTITMHSLDAKLRKLCATNRFAKRH